MNNIMAGQTKEQRDDWETKLTRSIEELKIAAVSEPENKRVIDGKIKMVERTFGKRAHSQYCHKAKSGLGSTDSLTYEALLAREQYGIIMDMFGEGKNKLVR